MSDVVGKVAFNRTQTIITNRQLNLFIKSTITMDYYVNPANGLLLAAGTFITSDYIEVNPILLYSFRKVRYYAWYDINKTYIAGVNFGSAKRPAHFTELPPSNAKYVRFSFVATDIALDAMEFVQSETASDTINYPREMYSYQQKTNGIIPSQKKINLTNIIRLVINKTFRIYFRNLIDDNISNYNIHCTINLAGTMKQMSEYIEIIPSTSGTYTGHSIRFYDINNNIVAEWAGVFIVVADTVGNGVTKKILCIGDSTTASGIYTQRLLDLFDPDVMNITLLGSRGSGSNLHEGKSGWTATNYVTLATDNPFYIGGSFNFSGYMTALSYTGVDYVLINLGINDVFSPVDDTTLDALIDTVLSRFSTIVTSIKAYNSNTKICICATIPPSNSQDNFGISYGQSQSQWRYKRNNYKFTKKLMAKYINKEDTNIFIIPINTNLDIINNMNDGVHPTTNGYNQIGDTIYQFVKAFET